MTATSDTAIEALAEFLLLRDWPGARARISSSRRYEYRCRAAAILAGEAWAIRMTWPEAAYDIQTRSEWSPVRA